MTLGKYLKAPLPFLLALLFAMAGVLALGLALWFWPGHWRLESQTAVEAPADFVFAYGRDPNRWPEWSEWKDAPDRLTPLAAESKVASQETTPQAQAVRRHAAYRVALSHRAHAKTWFTVTPDSAHADRASLLTLGFEVDFGLHWLARRMHRNLYQETSRRFAIEAARIKSLAENDAVLAAAQKAADADSISRVPLDTATTEVLPAE